MTKYKRESKPNTMIYSGSVTELLSALLHSPSTQLESYFTRSTSSLIGGEHLTQRRLHFFRYKAKYRVLTPEGPTHRRLHFIRYKAKYRVLTQRVEPTQTQHNKPCVLWHKHINHLIQLVIQDDDQKGDPRQYV